MIHGAGILSVIGTVNEPDVFPDFSVAICYSLFKFSVNSVATPSTYLSLNGIVQSKSSKIQEETYTLELTLEDTDYTALQISLGEIAAQIDGVVLTEEVTLCPLTSTTYNNSDLTSTHENNVAAFNYTQNRPMIRADNLASVQPNFFFVDGTAQTITFSSSNLGETIKIAIPVDRDDVGVVGGPNGRGEIYRFQFEGDFITTSGDGPYTLQIPYLRRTSAPTLNFDGNAVNYTLTFEAVCGEGEERKPFKIFSPTNFVPLQENFVLQETGTDFILLEDGSDKILQEDSA